MSAPLHPIRILGLIAILIAATAAVNAQSVRLVEWVENAPLSDTDRIALGYPVPVPVDTPLPFAGFRSYEGLHARHQDLAATTPWVHGAVVGETRQGRSIWAYRLGDADLETAFGYPEQAMLTNAGIHAREWQSPEVGTGIMELLATSEPDHYLLDYLRDNANIVVIPVLNVDGFLQTQRYPSLNWLGGDPNYPDTWPRDGRMRRKNMFGPDEQLETVEDHLLGVDLNRNNDPFWASSPSGSSRDPTSLVYHGALPASEPEIRALDAAAQLGPADRLSMYTDVHSYSQVQLWGRNSNPHLAELTERLLNTFSNHHAAFPAGKRYLFSDKNSVSRNQGMGTTDEYFTHTYQVPSWTLEIEPSAGDHPGLPGLGADYGGLARNGHDGFILPESQIERVRTELAQTFAIAYYQQTGPSSIRRVQLVDQASGATVFDAEWDPSGPDSRSLFAYQAQTLQIGRPYRARVVWNKPMRWREDGTVVPLPGSSTLVLALQRQFTVGGTLLSPSLTLPRWLDQPGPNGFARYRDDALEFEFSFLDVPANRALVEGPTEVALGIGTHDLTGVRNDADPSTVARWHNGSWAGYEDANGYDDTDRGGMDSTVHFELTPEDLGDPFVIEPGTSSAWYDITRNGEGFMLEILDGGRAVMYWFTYDGEGRQDWYIAEGTIHGNRAVFPDLMRVSGGTFGPGFDPEQVVRTPVGSASFTWSSCESGVMKWVIDREGTAYRQGRMELARLSRVMGLECGQPVMAPEIAAGMFSGSWYDPSHSGEGYVVEVLADHRALVYWFSFDTEGNRRWFFGTGEIDGTLLVFDDLFTTSGGIFGEGFDPVSVSLEPWGRLELALACDGGSAHFVPSEAGFPAGELELVRLTVLDGLTCDS